MQLPIAECDDDIDDAKGRESIMTVHSQYSKNDLMTETIHAAQDLSLLIKDEDWHNIPAPIRDTCEGLVNF